jgi:hypothetical protein
MNTTYRVIGFGTSEEGTLFNQPAFCSTIGYACGIYDAHLHDPEMDGAVIIRVRHETWEVIQEFGTENMSISYSPLGVFRVERAPSLVMV